MNIPIDYSDMRKICLANSSSFAKLGKSYTTPTGGILVHIDNGSDILAVAHLDSVQSKKHFSVINVDGDDWVFNAQLDDRLGAYTILSLLPKMGLKFDILLTDDEETGQSTAQFFQTTKKYNWMFQFDRRKGDAVHYQYDTKFFKKRLRRMGFNDLSHGAFSDICYLDHLGCCGINIGVGYEDEHSLWAKANMTTYRKQVLTFVNFYNEYKSLHFRYEKPAWTPPRRGGGGRNYFNSDYWEKKETSTSTVYTKKETVTSIIPSTKKSNKHKCERCDTVLSARDQLESRYHGICVSCNIFMICCTGCDKVVRISDIKGKNLCEECYPRWLDAPSAFITCHECWECRSTLLSMVELETSGLCIYCERMRSSRDDY